MTVEKTGDLIKQLKNGEERSDKTDSVIRRIETKEVQLGEYATGEQVEDAAAECFAEEIAGSLGFLTDVNPREDSQEFMESASDAVAAFFDQHSWHYSKVISRPELVMYQLEFSLQKCSLTMKVCVEASPRVCRIDAVLPITADKTYEYLLCEAIVKINYDKRFGAFHYDESDGEVSYRYSFPIAHGVYMDELEQVFLAVQHTAASNYAEILKHCVGKYKIKELSDILKKTDALVADLNDDGV